VHRAIVASLNSARISGATTLRGIWGYHGDHAPHGDHFPRQARHVPVVTTVIATAEQISAAYDAIDPHTAERGLVTAEAVLAARPTAGAPSPALPRRAGGADASEAGGQAGAVGLSQKADLLVGEEDVEGVGDGLVAVAEEPVRDRVVARSPGGGLAPRPGEPPLRQRAQAERDAVRILTTTVRDLFTGGAGAPHGR
jgi:PII-like signaling protein